MSVEGVTVDGNNCQASDKNKVKNLFLNLRISVPLSQGFCSGKGVTLALLFQSFNNSFAHAV